MPSPSFSHASGTVTFTRAPQRPSKSLDLFQAESQSAGGAFFGFDSLDTEALIILHWPTMTEANLEDLEEFLTDTVNGMAETFTYTDVNTNTFAVRFAVPEIQSVERAYERYEVTVALLEAA